MTPFLSSEDEGLAVKVEHCVDAMLTDDGTGFAFYYNFLMYTFSDGEVTLSAKHYLDEPGTVNLHSIVPERPDRFMFEVLVYLGMRHGNIEVQTADGYQPVSDPLKQLIGDAVRVKFSGV